jgi:hypothetical protein
MTDWRQGNEPAATTYYRGSRVLPETHEVPPGGSTADNAPEKTSDQVVLLRSARLGVNIPVTVITST